MSTALIQIDDQKLRRQAFVSARKMLKQLERLEADIANFEAKDRDLFREWERLTFRKDHEKLEDRREERRRLARIYNWMVALADMEDLLPAQALRRLHEEEERYARGTPAERLKIEEIRRRRDEFIDQAQERREHRSEQAERRREERARREMQEEEERRQEEIEAIAGMDDHELDEWLQSPQIADHWLWLTLWDARCSGDASAFFRVWETIHEKMRLRFSREFEKRYGVPFREILQKMRSLHEQPADDEVASEPAGSPPHDAGAADAETVKLIYRQLVRKLHPDLNLEAEESVWRKSLWLRTQQAYAARDLRELKRLMQFTLLRLGELNHLRLSEILESQHWLEDEVGQIKQSIRASKKSPAWAFSRRKDFAPLERKIQRQLERELAAVDHEIEEIQGILNYHGRIAAALDLD